MTGSYLEDCGYVAMKGIFQTSRLPHKPTTQIKGFPSYHQLNDDFSRAGYWRQKFRCTHMSCA
ncbi:hypothetical protein DMH88_12590 [Escherichia coli]|nr:hypothetical protein [Escherichia coli]